MAEQPTTYRAATLNPSAGRRWTLHAQEVGPEREAEVWAALRLFPGGAGVVWGAGTTGLHRGGRKRGTTAAIARVVDGGPRGPGGGSSGAGRSRHRERRQSRMSSWRQQQSVVVGGGKAHSGCLYRALVPLTCAWCGGTVGVGETFTRSSRGPVREAWRGRLLHIVCGACGHRTGQDRTGQDRSDHETT